jgi:hypothetical protein
MFMGDVTVDLFLAGHGHQMPQKSQGGKLWLK